MARAEKILDATALPWVWSADAGIGTKVLNEDTTSGARTVLLCSKPRPVTEATRRRAHYHEGVEEFLSLGPAFSFDDNVWHHRLSYLFLPPGTVHGTDVQVPEGYLLFLRTGGGAEPRFLAAHGPPRVPGIPTAVPDPLAAKWQSQGGLSVLQFSTHARMLRLGAGFSGSLAIVGDRTELFVVDGCLALGDGQSISSNGYVCRDGQAIGPVTSERETMIFMAPA